MNEISNFAARLRNARLMRGLSMEALCKKIEGAVTKQAVSKYETGKCFPNSTVLLALCNALEIRPDYLFREREEITDIRYRRLSKFKAKQRKMVCMAVEDAVERTLEAEAICSIERKFSTDFSGQIISNHGDVIAAAKKLRNEWNIGNGAISSVTNLLEDNGALIIEIEADSSFSGLNGTLSNNTPIVVVNSEMTPERRRLTAFHELAHALLNFASDTAEKEQEKWCNTFANEVLIPSEAFLKTIGERRTDIAINELQNLQAEYGISIDALMYKAKSLGVITEGRHRTHCIKKNSDPKFKQLVEASRFPEERSVRLENMVYKALANGVVSMSKAALLLNQPLEEISKQFILA